VRERRVVNSASMELVAASWSKVIVGVVGGSWAMPWAWFGVCVDQRSMNGNEGHFNRTLEVFRSALAGVRNDFL
jgi:hypothetical protein